MGHEPSFRVAAASTKSFAYRFPLGWVHHSLRKQAGSMVAGPLHSAVRPCYEPHPACALPAPQVL
jgi:hypothetical protein